MSNLRNTVLRDERKVGINIGCGRVNYRPDTDDMIWVNCDSDPTVTADWRGDITKLHERYLGAADSIIAEDILEHIPYSETNKDLWKEALQSWAWCLKSGGTIRIQVPNLRNIATAILNTIDEDTANRVIYGERTSPWDTHYQLFTNQRLEAALLDLGLKIIESKDIHVNIVVVAQKP